MQAPLSNYLNNATKPSDSERIAGQLIANNLVAAFAGTNKKPNKRWTVVLRDPSGGRGGGGGATSDIVVYNDVPNDDNAQIVATLDVYTPERGTKADGMQKYIRGKVGTQCDLVCIDLRNFGGDAEKKAAEILGWKEFKGKIIVVNTKAEKFIGSN